MPKLKFSPIQRHLIDEACSNARIVLQEIKAKPLKGEALADMKLLEGVVQVLEILQLNPTKKK